MLLELVFLSLCVVAIWFWAFDLLWLYLLNLRSAAGEWEKEKAEHTTDAKATSDRLHIELLAMVDREHEEPYKPLYDRGRRLATDRIDDIEQALTTSGDGRAEEIPETRLGSSVLLLPLVVELMVRRGWHARSQQIGRSGGDARGALEEIEQNWRAIAGLGKEYKNRSQAERARAQKLSDEIQANRLPASDDMLTRSNEIVKLFDQANLRLAADDPAEPEVCLAYPDIIEGGKQIDRLGAEFQECCRQHELARARLDKIRDQVKRIVQEIKEEKKESFLVPGLESECSKWEDEIKDLRLALEHGTEDLDDRMESLSREIGASRKSLETRRLLRKQVKEQYEVKSSQLSSACEWTKKSDNRFEFDLTRSLMGKAKKALQDIQDMLPREDLQIENVKPLTVTVDQCIEKIRTNGNSHRRLLQEESSLRGRLKTALPVTVGSAVALAGRLEACHPTYHKVQPADLKDAGSKLKDNWAQTEAYGASMKESQFADVVADLRSIDIEHRALQKQCDLAKRNLEARDRDKTEAEDLLSRLGSPDQTLSALKSWKDAQEHQEYVESSVRQLGGQMQESAPDFSAILEQGKALLQRVEVRRKELKRQLDGSRTRLAGTGDKLKAMQTQLDRFQDGSPWLWDDTFTSLERDMNYWQSGFESVQGQSIERMDQHQEDGESLLTRLEEFYERIQQENIKFTQALSGAREAVSAADKGILNLRQLLTRGVNYGSAGWNSFERDQAEGSIGDSKSQLEDLQAGRSKYTVQEAGRQARDVRGDAQSAARTIEGEQRKLKRAIEWLEGLSRQLQELVQRCKRFALASDQDVREQWRETERDIDQWKENCRNADSPEDAEVILNRAIQSARNFEREYNVP